VKCVAEPILLETLSLNNAASGLLVVKTESLRKAAFTALVSKRAAPRRRDSETTGFAFNCGALNELALEPAAVFGGVLSSKDKSERRQVR
jgi:hypothetical protein